MKRLLWAVGLIELVVAGLALLARSYFGPRLALLVGLGIGGLVLVAFVLIVAFSFVATWLTDRWSGEGRPPPRGG